MKNIVKKKLKTWKWVDMNLILERLLTQNYNLTNFEPTTMFLDALLLNVKTMEF